ncbi:MAG TPA: DUF599 domain-containing protein [Devosia sp.]|nr:DUF599 domain-containing protein [Devosia sp.]
MSLLATVLPLICWFAYNNGVPVIERRYPSLSSIMSLQRRRWVANAAHAETPYDAILAGNLMGSVSFLASTAALLVLATFAGFGQLENITRTLASVTLDQPHTQREVEIHLAVLLSMFVLAFFAFTLSLRQFNHFCIMLGALDRKGRAGEAELDAIAQINVLAARNFNNGIRALYFAVPMVAWFIADWLAIAVAILMLGFVVYREFFSSAHRAAAAIAVDAGQRRDDAAQKTGFPPSRE